MHKLKPFEISLEGRHLVEASAGTGKTYNITSLFIRCLIEKKIEIDQILVLTYTKAATAELKERILSRLHEAATALRQNRAPKEDEFLRKLLSNVANHEEALHKLHYALHNFDLASIFTIHSFCQQALQEQSFLSGVLFDSELVSDDPELLQETVDDWWRQLVHRAETQQADRIWLHILQQRGYNPEELKQLVSKGLGKPYLQLSYEEPKGEELEQELLALNELFIQMKEMWQDEQAEIVERMFKDGMNKSRYKREDLEEYSAIFNRELPDLNPNEKFNRFSIDYMREQGTNKNVAPPEHPFFELARDYLQQVERVQSWMPWFKKDLLEQTRATMRREKLSRGVLNYDDLLILLQEALDRPGTGQTLAEVLRKKFPIALVDEFQDTDPIQYDILTSLYPEGSDQTGLFLIGDPKQSIYSFRGADLFSYLEARDQVPENQRYGLYRNFRSNEELVQSMNALFSLREHPFFVEAIPFNPVEAADLLEVDPVRIDGEQRANIQFLKSVNYEPSKKPNKDTARSRAAAVTAESIAGLLRKGARGEVKIGDKNLTSKDIAVLVRKHDQAEMIRRELEKRSIKSVQYSSKSVFETEEARNMEFLLRAVSEPRNERAVRTALATEFFPHDATQLLQLKEDEQQWTNVLNRFSGWNLQWQEEGFIAMFRSFLLDAGVEQHLAGLEQGERKLTNTLQLGELLQSFHQENQGSMFELIKWLRSKRSDPDSEAEDEQLRLESDEKLVRIVTIHRSKGLEYPVVYCPFLWDGKHIKNHDQPVLYHDLREGQANRACLDLNEKQSDLRDLHRYWSAREEISDELRLMYVAITRAQQQCTMVLESPGDIEFSPLGYVMLGREEVKRQLRGKILSEKTDSIKRPIFSETISRWIEQHPKLFALNHIDEGQQQSFILEDIDNAEKGHYRRYSGATPVRSRSIVSSFSSLMHASSAESNEMNDEFFLPDELHQDQEEVPLDMFGFPRGPQAGTCVHTIFEDLNFAVRSHLEELVTSNLQQFGFDEKWKPVLQKMVGLVLEKDIKNGIKLGELPENELLKEMEFYFALAPFQRQALLEIIRNETPADGASVPEGFMKGFIDLIFKAGDQFYIADYKTNYLGDSHSDYTPDLLRDEMEMAGYDVQYHIYSVALHRYLKARLPGYEYDRHFGGVFYLFVRGMEATGPNGIYFDKPNYETIAQLDQLFSKKEAQP